MALTAATKSSLTLAIKKIMNVIMHKQSAEHKHEGLMIDIVQSVGKKVYCVYNIKSGHRFECLRLHEIPFLQNYILQLVKKLSF